MSEIRVRLPNSLEHQLKELADQEGISPSQFIATAVAEKTSALMTEEYLSERSDRASRDAYDAVLDRVPDAEPDERDRMD